MNKRWLVGAVVSSYLVTTIGGAALKPGYSHIGHFISELNASGTPYAWAIGWLGFVPFGLLSAGLLIVTSPSAPVRGASRFGYWLLMAEPIAYIGSAIAPCDAGCPSDGSLNQTLHNVLSLITFFATMLGLLLLAFTPGLSATKRLVWISVSCVWSVLFGLMIDDSMTALRGLLQRLAEGVVYSTLCACAWRVLGANTSSKPTLLEGEA